MYASKRTIGKQELWAEAPKDKNAEHKIKHNNKGNRPGGKYRVQTIFGEDGFPKGEIVHIQIFGNSSNIKRVKKRLPKCMKNQPK